MKNFRLIRIKALVTSIVLIALNASAYAQHNLSPDSYTGSRANLGLFGARPVADLTICHSNHRLFAAVENPVSVFFSDDNAANWYMAFPVDSLEFNLNKQGWGGGGVKVLANSVGWVAAFTAQQGGTHSASVISYNEGDTGTWVTAMDGWILQRLIGHGMNVASIALSDYWLYSSVNNYLTRVRESAPINISTDIIDLNTYISGLSPNVRVISMSVANTSSGFPLCFVLDDNYDNVGQLYKFDGTTATLLGTPSGSASVMSVYLHPASAGNDTMIINIKTGSHSINHYKSIDAGTTWNDITFSDAGYISDFDHSDLWSLPASNNSIIIMPGVAVSEDLGATWIAINNQTYNDAMVIDPSNSNTAFATSLSGLGIVSSTAGAAGPYILADNIDLSAVRVNKIDRTASRSVFYVATGSGLAYTTAYNNPAVPNHEKWMTPYGTFPVPNVGTGFGATAVTIDPNDSQHVVAGYSGGLSYTTTGETGFVNVTPSGWHTSPSLFVKDVRFVTSLIVVAVVGGENSEAKDLGDIWRSVDGGINWTKVTPAAFNNGNTIAMGASGTDTVLYVGTGLAMISLENEGRLWRSTDLGITWTIINTGPTGHNFDGTTIDNVPIYDIAVDPRGKDTLYIAAGCNLHYAFVKSTNGGLSYTDITDATGEGSFSAVSMNELFPDSVFMAIRRDIMTYNAITNTSTTIFRGLPGELIPDLEYGSVLAGTTTGFYKITQYSDPPYSVDDKKQISLNEINAFPNPLNDELNIEFLCTNETSVIIQLYDILGNSLTTVCNGWYKAGKHKVTFNSSCLKAGNYILRYIDKDKVISKLIQKS